MLVQGTRFLTTAITYDVLSDAAEKVLSVVKERFAAENPQIGPLAVKVRNDHAGLLQATTRGDGSTFTPEIKARHGLRVESLVAWRYLLRTRQKENTKPEIAKAGRELKALLVKSGLWRITNLSHVHMSRFIASLIQLFSVPENRALLETLGMTEAFDVLVDWERQYGALQTQRIEERAGDTGPRLLPARNRLLQSLNALVAYIAVNAQIDADGFGAAAEQIAMVVKATNAVTRSGKTRRDNAAASTPLSDRESEQAEAAVNGQGSTSAGGAAEHAAFTPQGNPVTGVTPETNPVDPLIGKGISTA
jgi:hypothetical protein